MAKKKDKNDCPYCGYPKENNKVIGFDEEKRAIIKCMNCKKNYTRQD